MKKEIKPAFSLAEALITLLVVAIITIATIPVITKKHRDRNQEKHGAFACYWSGNTLVGRYLINGEKTSAKTSYDAQEGRTGCVFDPPIGVKNLIVTVVGGGGGGARGYYEDKSHVVVGENGGAFTVPADGDYRILLMGAGGAGGHTSGGEVGHKYGSSQAPAVSGSPAGLIVSDWINLKEHGTINYTIGVQGWAREDNDAYPQHGKEATASYSYNGDSFSIAAQGGGGGASMNYEGSDDSHFYFCVPNNASYIKFCDKGGPISMLSCKDSTTASDRCDSYLDNGFYRRYAGYVDGNSQSRPYLRSAHAGGARVSTSGNISSSSFQKHIMKGSMGIAKVYEYERPTYAYKMTSSGSIGRRAAYGQDNQGRPFWNTYLTYDLMQTFKIWQYIDQDHPFGSGGYGTGGGRRNHRSPVGNGGPGVMSIIWSYTYSGLGGKAGGVLQIPFAQMPNKTLAFPGKGGAGETSWYKAGNGQPSCLKNYPSAKGGEGASTISISNATTYNKKYAGGKLAGGDGVLANISTRANSTTGGAGGLSPLSSNGYVNNGSLTGLTRQMFSNGQEIAMFTSLLGAGAGGGGGAVNGETKTVGDGGAGSSGIVFIQW